MRLSSRDGTTHLGLIKEVSKKDMPLKKDGWRFNWKEFAKDKNKRFFGLYVDDLLQGMLSVEVVKQPYEIMFFMHHIELAPNNYGSDGEYLEVAGCLMAYACRLSLNWLEMNNPYFGYMMFESKTKLIERYESVYGATCIYGHKMCFTPEAGRNLIEKYLDS